MSEQLYDFFGAMFHRYFRPPSTHIREWVEHSSTGCSRSRHVDRATRPLRRP